MSEKYLIIEQHIFGHNVKDMWSVKFADQSNHDAFTKLVALETLNKDKDHMVYYIVNMKSLWTKNQDDKINNEIKTAEEKQQQELF